MWSWSASGTSGESFSQLSISCSFPRSWRVRILPRCCHPAWHADVTANCRCWRHPCHCQAMKWPWSGTTVPIPIRPTNGCAARCSSRCSHARNRFVTGRGVYHRIQTDTALCPLPRTTYSSPQRRTTVGAANVIESQCADLVADWLEVLLQPQALECLRCLAGAHPQIGCLRGECVHSSPGPGSAPRGRCRLTRIAPTPGPEKELSSRQLLLEIALVILISIFAEARQSPALARSTAAGAAAASDQSDLRLR